MYSKKIWSSIDMGHIPKKVKTLPRKPPKLGLSTSSKINPTKTWAIPQQHDNQKHRGI